MNVNPGRRYISSGFPDGRSGKNTEVAKTSIEQTNIAGNKRTHLLNKNTPMLEHFSRLISITKPEMRKKSWTPSQPL
jgi:hypothetical protein